MNLPNAISLGRLLLVPLIVWLLITGATIEAFVLFLVAGLSDAVDGLLARRLDLRSRLGSYLDPLADKALLVCVFVALGAQGVLPPWLVFLVVGRDVLLVCGTALAQLRRQRPAMLFPIASSKVNTTVQIVLAAVCLGYLAGIPFLEPLVLPLVWLVAATTIVSGVAYAVRWLSRPEERGREPPSQPEGGGETP